MAKFDAVMEPKQFETMNRPAKLHAMCLNFCNYESLSEKDKSDQNLALESLKTALINDEQNKKYDMVMLRIFSKVPVEISENREFLMRLFNSLNVNNVTPRLRTTGIISHFSKDLLDDKLLALSFLMTYPKAISLLSNKLKDDADIVGLATNYEGGFIAYASERCQMDRKIQAKIVCNSIHWSIESTPENIVDTEFMREIYALSPSKLLSFKEDNPFYNSHLANINEALDIPQQNRLFFIRKLMELDEYATSLEKAIKDNDSKPSGNRLEDISNKMMLKKYRLTLTSNIATIEHLMDKLSIKDLDGVAFQAGIMQDSLKRKSLLSIRQETTKSNSIKKDRKLSVKL